MLKVATPVDWKQGGSVMVVPGVKQEQTGELFPKGVTVHSVPSGKVNLWNHKVYTFEFSEYASVTTIFR